MSFLPRYARTTGKEAEPRLGYAVSMSSRRWLCCLAAAVGGLALLAPLATYRLGFARGVLRPTPPRERDTGPCPPKRIHQIFIAESSVARVPEDWVRRGRQKWIEAHAANEVRFEEGVPVVDERSDGWLYFFWDGHAIEALLAASYPELVETYRGYSRWVQRVDLARYAILDHYGGIYADLDVKCRRSWAPVLATCPEIAVARADQRFVSGAFLSTDLMVSRPGHPLLAQILKEMPRKATSWMSFMPPYLAVMLTSGPWHLSNEFLAFTERNPWPAGALLILGDGYYTGDVTPKKLVGHLDGDTWHEWDVALLRRAWDASEPWMLYLPLLCLVACARGACRRRQREFRTTL